MTTTRIEADGIRRCSWCSATPDYVNYHDTEWGFPVDDDRRLFEKMCFESFQSGLSWRTILEKRENFRRAFDNFEFDKVADYTERDVERLLLDAGIVRHRGKIEAVINNACRVQELIKREGSLATFIWRFEPNVESQDDGQIPATTAESTVLSKDLKKQGWKFVGPTTMYAFMQSMGLVNDHMKDCASWAKVDHARKNFRRPGRS